MLLNKHELRFKEFYKIRKEIDQIWNKQRNTPSVKLDKPYQIGWILSLTLSNECLRRKDGLDLLRVLNICKIDYTTRNISDIKLARRVKSYKHFRQIYYTESNHNRNYHGPSFGHISEQYYNTLTPSIQKHFYKWIDRGYWGTKEEVRYSPIIPDVYVMVKVLPNMITHQRTPDPELKSRESFLHKKSDNLEYTGYNNLWSGERMNKPNSKSKYKADIKKYLKNEIEDIGYYNERLTW